MDSQQNTNQHQHPAEAQHPEFVTGTLFGALIGGTAALLLSPKSGKEMRQLVVEYLKDWEQEAEHFARDAEEVVATFQQALEEHIQASEQVTSQARHWRDQAKEAEHTVADGMSSAKSSVSRVVEEFRAGWDAAREQEAPRPYHRSVAVPDDSIVKMGETEARRQPNQLAADTQASVDHDEELEEPAFKRSRPTLDDNFLAKPATSFEDDEPEPILRSKPEFQHPTWQAASTGRRLGGSANLDLHHQDRQHVQQLGNQTPATGYPPLASEDATHNHNQPQPEPERDAEAEQAADSRRGERGLKPLYGSSTVIESREPIEPKIQPITVESSATSTTSTRTSRTKRLFRRK